MKEFNAGKKLRFGGVELGLTMGKYHYWDEFEDDNTKRFHYMEGSDGKNYHIDFSPYYRPTDKDLESLREIVRLTGYVPDASDNGGHNFSYDPNCHQRVEDRKTDMEVLLDRVIADIKHEEPWR